MTCMQNGCVSNIPHNDWMFYVLYHEDRPFLSQIISTSVRNLGAGGPDTVPELSTLLDWFANIQTDSVHVLRAKLLVLLDQDEATRKEFTVFRPDSCRLRPPLPLAKADRFFAQLHETVIPQWLCNETISLNTLVDSARNAYLIS